MITATGSRHRAIVLGLGFALGALAGSREETVKGFSERQRNHWAFQKVSSPAIPAVRGASWVRNSIDAFVLGKLEARNLQPSPPADKVTLLRRVSLDLTGLPPTPQEVEHFLADASPDAYEKVVDRLLASPHYGERWARHWLDVARFAESQGFKADETRPNAWRYRDYVIQSFNQDKPYDRFVREQLAGDELWPNDPQARVATAFNRHYPDEYNARNLMQRRQEILNEITNVVGAAFLGLTVECAQCHDHKFDPISHKDYYSLQAFFANTAPDDRIILASPVELQQYQSKLAVWEGKTREIRDEIASILAPRRKQIWDEFFEKYPPEVQEAITKPAAERTPYEWQLYHQAKLYLEPDSKTVAQGLKGPAKDRYRELMRELEKFAGLHPGQLPEGTGMRDISAQAPQTYVLSGGNYLARQEPVEPAFLSVLEARPPQIEPLPGLNSTGRRSALANWLASPDHPLTARVMVNRIWHYHFGKGIVATPSDFGLSGARPTHPELLDWLTARFIRDGWSMKKLHKLIVTSNTYRQASSFREDAAKADPDNRLLWRFPRTRLEGEVIRDSAIFVAGALNTKVGGPSVYPELPEGMPAPRGGWEPIRDPADNYRRSVYIFVRRNTPYPMLKALDFPDTTMSCGRRDRTITAPQALTLMNDRVALNWAQRFAGRVIQVAGAEPGAQIDQVFMLAYSRKPDGLEKDTMFTFLAKQAAIIQKRLDAGEKIALPSPMPQHGDPARMAALVDLCHTVLNSNEFVYRN